MKLLSSRNYIDTAQIQKYIQILYDKSKQWTHQRLYSLPQHGRFYAIVVVQFMYYPKLKMYHTQTYLCDFGSWRSEFFSGKTGARTRYWKAFEWNSFQYQIGAKFENLLNHTVGLVACGYDNLYWEFQFPPLYTAVAGSGYHCQLSSPFRLLRSVNTANKQTKAKMLSKVRQKETQKMDKFLTRKGTDVLPPELWCLVLRQLSLPQKARLCVILSG